MKAIYIHDGEGHYLGSTIVVVAGTEAEARRMIRTELDAKGRKLEPVEELTKKDITDTQVVISINGDY